MIGFGISNKETFQTACKFANGAIIGSAFVKAMEGDGSISEKIVSFTKSILN